MSDFKFITQTLGYSQGAEAIVALSSSGAPEIFNTRQEPVTFGTHRIAPWGRDNDLPAKIMEKSLSHDVVSPNLLFNVQAGYAQGIKPMKRVIEGNKVMGYEECLDEEVLQFFENNDVSGYFLEQISDMVTFFNVFPEIILSNDGKKITGLRHLEATYSRWGSKNENEKEITRHYYAEWESGSPKNKKFILSRVLSRYDTCAQLQDLMKSGCKDRSFVLQVNMPTPGRTYYSHPYWWSIFKSGWYELSVMLPAFKKALIKNHLSVRYIIYISDEYWKDLAKRENVSQNDTEKFRAIQEKDVKRMLDFLKGEDGKGGGIVSAKKNQPVGNSIFEDKYIQIQSIEPGIKGGEFIEDSEEASNMICYAMGVHANLNGATPGKGKGSLGGSDKRELFNIKQALMAPFRNRLLIPLNLIKRYNNWDENLVFMVPDHIFTTLDVSKTGQKSVEHNP